MNVFITHPMLVWLCLGFLFLIVEMLSGTYFFLWIAGAAFFTAVTTLILQIDVNTQCVLFAISSVIAIGLWQWLRPNTPNTLPDNGLNNRLASYIGRECVLTQPMVNGAGRIHLDDSQWSAISLGDDLNIPSGTRVRVCAVNGMILTVTRI